MRYQLCTANFSPTLLGDGLHGKHSGELVQTCASVPLQTLEYLHLKKYDEKKHDILALGFMEM